MDPPPPSTKASSLRWEILRHAFLRHPSPNPDNQSEMGIKRISRKAIHGFNLIPFHVMEDDRSPDENSDSLPTSNHSGSGSSDVCVFYALPINGAPKLYLYQRVDNGADLNDFKICNRHKIDNTGLLCCWPSEDVLAYYCLSHADIFRSKKVIELGSGYGLAGLVIAAATEASEVVISDGNPQVVDYFWHLDGLSQVFELRGPPLIELEACYSAGKMTYKRVFSSVFTVLDNIQRNINANSGAFGGTLVNSMILHWDQGETSDNSNSFDVVVASDCTFFKEFHKGLAQTVKFLLKNNGPSEAVFFSPKRGDSLDKFLVEIKRSGLHFSISEIYDKEVWRRHQGFISGNDAWPNYEKDHCYPLLVRIAL